MTCQKLKVDAHVHVFTNDMPLIDNPRHAPTYSFTHEQLIATHGRARRGVRGDRGGEPLGRLQRLHHRGAARASQAAARHRDPQAHGRALRARSDGRDGIVGVRLPFIGMPKLPDITTFEYRALFRRLADLDWHVHLMSKARTCRKSCRSWKPPASRSWSTISAGPIRAPASTAKASRRCCARSRRAAPG